MPRRSRPRTKAARPADVVIDCKLGQDLLRQTSSPCATATCRSRRARSPASSAPPGCGKSTVLRSLNRMNDLIRGFRFEGHVHFHGQDIYGRRRGPGGGAPLHRHGVPAAQPVLDEHLRQRRLRPAPQPLQGQRRRARREGPAAGGAVGRGQGQAQEQRPVALRRPAAAPVHRPRHRHRAGRAADGRAVLGARSDRHPADRGADGRAQGELHDRHRHPQHAAGPAGGRHDGVLLGGHLQGRPHRLSGRDRAPPGRSSRTRGSSSPRNTSRASSAEAGARTACVLGPDALRSPRWRGWRSSCPRSARTPAGRGADAPRSCCAAPARPSRRRSTRSGSHVYRKQNPDVAITYDAVGSGEGQKRFLANAVDFGASDAALTDEQMASVKPGAQLVPVTAGMVVLAYNLPGLGGDAPAQPRRVRRHLRGQDQDVGRSAHPRRSTRA